jgi:hypothetical protein
MSRTQLEMLANFLVVLYLVSHGVSVPREGQAGWLSALVKLGGASAPGLAAWSRARQRPGRRAGRGLPRRHPGLFLS